MVLARWFLDGAMVQVVIGALQPFPQDHQLAPLFLLSLFFKKDGNVLTCPDADTARKA